MDLTEAIAAGLHNRSAQIRAEGDEQYEAFITCFPPSVWGTMTLDQYALGTANNRASYSYALEWGTARLGSIRGGSALKHLIWRRESGEWEFPGSAASVDAAWAALRAGFRLALQLADHDQWAQIADIAVLRAAKVVKLKTLYLYHRDGVLPVYSHEHLKHFAHKLELPIDDDILLLNRRLLAHLKSVPGLEQADGLDLQNLLYQWTPPAGTDDPQWVKIAPGPNADKWPDCLTGGYICVGWDEVGDLSLFDSEEQFRSAFAESQPTKPKSLTTRKAKELWRLTQLKPDDRIVANRGTGEVLAIGTVVDPGYQWRPERPEYKHTVSVEWDTSAAQRLDPPVTQWATTTVLPLPKELIRRIAEPHARDVQRRPLLLTVDNLEEADYHAWGRALERKKQLVFYGPPGTGKTRAARRFARWWLVQQRQMDTAAFPTAAAIDAAFADPGYCSRAWWVTASPSVWSWSEMLKDDKVGFRRGRITRHYDDVSVGDVVVCYEAAPVQRIVALARVVACHRDDPDDLEPLRLVPLRLLPHGPTWQQMESDDLLAKSEPVKHNAQGTLFALSSAQFQHMMTLAGVGDEYLDRRPADIVATLTQLTFHASYSYEEFIEGYRPIAGAGPGLSLELRDGIMKRVCRTAAADQPNSYVLLIDELNRANVPRVFGELITVIEADKRGTPVVLPGSATELNVPESVYVIATMNTADRSIRTLDAALRRRFAFVEMMPNPDLLAGAVIDDLALDLFLAELNRRISASAGRERQVGHSFFLANGNPIGDADALAEVMLLEVIPLLQELAYDDYATLTKYLGPALVDVEEQRLTGLFNDPTGMVAALAREYQARPDMLG